MASRPCAGVQPGIGTGTGTNLTDAADSNILEPTLKENSCDTSDLIVIIELDDILKKPECHPSSTVQEAMTRLVHDITEHLADFRSVVVRGWNKHDVPVDFSKESLELMFGGLGQRVHYFDCFQFAQNRDADSSEDLLPFHQDCTLEEFASLVDDPHVCGNWLACKDFNPSPPSFVKPVLHSMLAWNLTSHEGLVQKPQQHKYSSTPGGPNVIRAANWSTPGWRLVSHSGAFHTPHNDCCGFCTYVIAEHGCKIWGIMSPKKRMEMQTSAQMREESASMRDLPSDKGRGYNCDMVTVVLETGDAL